MNPQILYDEVRKWYALSPPVIGLVSLLVDAPFGRFSLSDSVSLQFDGVKSWIVMETVSPVMFIISIFKAYLATGTQTPPLQLSPRDPRTLLASLFLIHYINRAIISPLRSPSRSKSHIIVPIAAVFFNTVNGSLMGTYLSSPVAYSFLSNAFEKPLFWVGVTMWVAGIVGNILHDEVLFNIRRDALRKQKENEEISGEGKGKSKKPYYGIPTGYLYRYISYPNYFCEWFEWAGYALASSPIPALSLTGLVTAAPPWLFLLSEIFLMSPRAYKGHKWYLEKFPSYPKERKAVIPFVL